MENLIEHSETTQELISEAADSPSIDLRILAAESLQASVEILRNLAESNSSLIREAVATNPSTDLETLTKLVEDENREVRVSVLDNPSLPQEVKTRLANKALVLTFLDSLEGMGVEEDEVTGLVEKEISAKKTRKI